MSNIDGSEPFFSYEKHKNEAGFGDLPDASTYYPRFSGWLAFATVSSHLSTIFAG